MNLSQRVRNDLTEAMKADKKVRVSVLRMLLAELHNREIKLGRQLQDEDAVRIVRKAIAQRRESIREFHRGGRDDLVEREEQELSILQEYAPKMMEEEKVEEYVDEAIVKVGASEPRDLGRVMAAVMPKLSGKAEGSVVNRIVREKLSS